MNVALRAEAVASGSFVPWSARADSPGWVVEPGGCHVWVGGRLKSGYGEAWDAANKRMCVVHRARYEREVGPIPEGMDLDHFACSNRACCNPAHVRPVSRQENLLRGVTIPARLRARTRCPKGHELAGDNLNPWWAKRGYRSCQTCVRERDRARRPRKQRSA